LENIKSGVSTAPCSICSQTLSESNFQFQFIDEKLICKSCIERMYVKCNICGLRHKKENTLSDFPFNTGKIVICKPCVEQRFKKCSCCEQFVYINEVHNYNEIAYCQECYRKNFETCPTCNAVFKRGTITRRIHDVHQRKMCDKCWAYYGPILAYNHKPSFDVVGRGPHYLGVELEVEVADHNKAERGLRAAEIMNILGDFAILKEDGSLTVGFEICTVPASLSEHRAIWNKFFDAVPQNLMSYNAEKCGLHVHCSRRPLTVLAVAKAVVFVNDPANKQFIELIACRPPNKYCLIKNKRYWSVNERETGGRDDRFEAINLINKETIEFRIFRGTLNRSSFFKALEFCAAMVSFCMCAKHSVKDCRKLENFIKFVSESRKEYPYLYAFIASRWLKQPDDKWITEHGFGTAFKGER
jgi:hypothetical protein